MNRLILSALALTLIGAAASAGEVVAKGAFIGKSNHKTSGAATIEKEGDKWVVRLGDDFFHDGAPDPKVALGHNGFKKDAILAPLAQNTGGQTYEVPAGVDPSSMNEVWIWCEKYNVPLGQAKLN